ncbi:hypothetical protein [Hymenobacter coccineus]|uniref:HEAT repeat domain-containing protein n=1 Tax=Hymenobacter coccineus TaxID=1908235 RepID=A0A1G1TG00_9BACT|nr:hypothetical protein [Hymenobacter coccineus]OGX89794.1 hypothetical protein BEN49_24460 [Hymenobacter coccineus]
MAFSRKATLAEIAALRHHPDALGHYLRTLAEENPHAIELLGVYESLLNEPDWYLKEVGLYVLLFHFKRQNEGYKERALAILNDGDEDFEVRLWAATGLAECYHGTKDPAIMNGMLRMLGSTDVGSSLRNVCLQCVVKVWALTSLEVFQRAHRELSHDEALALTKNMAEFKAELQLIQHHLIAS